MSASFGTPWTVACQAPLSIGFSRETDSLSLTTREAQMCEYIQVFLWTQGFHFFCNDSEEKWMINFINCQCFQAFTSLRSYQQCMRVLLFFVPSAPGYCQSFSATHEMNVQKGLTVVFTHISLNHNTDTIFMCLFTIQIEPTCKAGDTDLIPGSGRSSGKGNSNPLQYFCLGNPMDRGTWQATFMGLPKSRT